MNRTIRLKRYLTLSIAASLVFTLAITLTNPVSGGDGGVFTNPAPITVPDPGGNFGQSKPYPSSITVSGLSGTITNVTATINNFNHSFPDDADILLVGPGAQNIRLLSDCGGSIEATNRTITFDDAAAASVSDAGPLLTGTFKPTNIGAADTFLAPAPAASASTTMAAAFNTIAPNGTWSLYVADDLFGDQGTIGNGWSLNITTTMNPATSFTSGGTAIFINDRGGLTTPYPSTITVSSLPGAITDVNVTLTGFTHTFPSDLSLMLVGPTGKRMIIMSTVGGDIVVSTPINITLDDSAALPLSDVGPLTTGTFKPTNYVAGEPFSDLLPPYPSPTTATEAAYATTFDSVFDGTDANGVWKLYVIDNYLIDTGSFAGGWSLDISTGGSFGAKRFTNGDFEGDGLTDVAVQRPTTNDWYWRESTAYANRSYPGFGLAGDLLVPGDYDGDRKTDIAVFRGSTGEWHILDSSTSILRSVAWGTDGDVPVPADYDGDGKYDLAVYRTGSWYILLSAGGSRGILWGNSGDIPVQGHFNGTSGADFTVFRPSDKTWYILNNAASSFRFETFGATGDVLVPGDYDSDGKTDVAVYRQSSGDWFIRRSTAGDTGIHLGAAGDIPVPGDYDGDSRTDVAVWRPSTASWYLLNSGVNPGLGALRIDNWGFADDVPIARQYLPAQIVP